MSDDTSVPDSEQPSTALLSRLVELNTNEFPSVSTPAERALRLLGPATAREVVSLRRENEALRAQVAAHEDADRRWSADLRAVEAERDELRRDYADLIVLDTEGLRARIVALEDAAEQHRMNLEAAHAETIQYRKWRQEAIEEITVLQASTDAKRAAEHRTLLETMLADARRENDEDNAEFARAVGQPIADLIAEYRHTIRQLTHRLNEALAALDKAGAK